MTTAKSVDVRAALLDVSKLSWQPATKTKPLRAKLLDLILVDPSVLDKFLLDTLEGTQSLKAGSMICIGIGNDAWQQKKEKLFEKYNITDVDKHGWMTCVPKPENKVFCAEVIREAFYGDTFSLIGQWGDDHVIAGKNVHLQYGKVGDYICRNVSDPTDMWVVVRKMFDSTYDVKK